MSVDTVARFAADTRWEALPGAVQARMRAALLDTIGCMLGGRPMPASEAAAAAARDGGPVMAACALGIAASALDFDDGHYEGGGVHLGSLILPALLAAAPPDTGAARLLEALAIGYEIAIRAGWLMAPRAPSDPYHTSGAPTCIGAAAAVARLIGLDAAGIRRALRIAAAQAPMATLQLPMVKESIGWGAATAVGAAWMAKAGFDGSDRAVRVPPPLGIAPTPFDGPRGEEPFVVALGREWQSPAAYIKPYPCCRAIHSALDGVSAVLSEAGWRGATVEHIEIVTGTGCEALDYLQPASPEHAQFSFPYAIGCLLATGAVEASHFLGEALADPAILDAARRVALVGSADLGQASPAESYPAIVSVTCRGGTRQLRIDHARGSAARPLTAPTLAAKFLANAALVLPDPAAAALLEQLEGPIAGIAVGALQSILAQPLEIVP